MTDRPQISSSENEYASKGSTANVECKVRSVPLPEEVTWIRNNEVIDFATSEHYSFSEVKKPDGVINTLHIQSAGSGDFGLYTCTVVNSIGIDFLAITLIEKGQC